MTQIIEESKEDNSSINSEKSVHNGTYLIKNQKEKNPKIDLEDDYY